MGSLSAAVFMQLRQDLAAAHEPLAALARTVGGARLGGGVWRLFSGAYPPGGAEAWNSSGAWRTAWKLAPAHFTAFGEDMFGNQLGFLVGSPNAVLWNHEDGSFHDLLLDPVDLLEAVNESGLDWIDFYSAEALVTAARRMADVPDDSHLHWTQPLILGGTCQVSNTSVVERAAHLVGHAEVFIQLGSVGAGQHVVVK